MVTVPSWQLVILGGSLNPLTMLHLGKIRLLELQVLYGESPTVTVTSWQLVTFTLSAHQLTVHLGHLVIPQVIMLYMESPMETALSRELVIDILLVQVTLRIGLLWMLLMLEISIIGLSPTAGAVPSWVLGKMERLLDRLTMVKIGIM